MCNLYQQSFLEEKTAIQYLFASLWNSIIIFDVAIPMQQEKQQLQQQQQQQQSQNFLFVEYVDEDEIEKQKQLKNQIVKKIKQIVSDFVYPTLKLFVFEEDDTGELCRQIYAQIAKVEYAIYQSQSNSSKSRQEEEELERKAIQDSFFGSNTTSLQSLLFISPSQNTAKSKHLVSSLRIMTTRTFEIIMELAKTNRERRSKYKDHEPQLDILKRFFNSDLIRKIESGKKKRNEKDQSIVNMNLSLGKSKQIDNANLRQDTIDENQDVDEIKQFMNEFNYFLLDEFGISNDYHLLFKKIGLDKQCLQIMPDQDQKQYSTRTDYTNAFYSALLSYFPNQSIISQSQSQSQQTSASSLQSQNSNAITKQRIKFHFRTIPHQIAASSVESALNMLIKINDVIQLKNSLKDEDEKTSSYLQLVAYLGQTESLTELKYQYLRDLARLHEDLHNYAEAGEVMHALQSQFRFSSKKIDKPILYYPEVRTEGQRKLAVIQDMVRMMKQGDCFERAIQILEPFVQRFKKRPSEFKMLSIFLQLQSECLYQLINAPRNLYPRYYYVKIIRENETKLGQFLDLLKQKYPGAQICNTEKQADEILQPYNESMRELKAMSSEDVNMILLQKQIQQSFNVMQAQGINYKRMPYINLQNSQLQAGTSAQTQQFSSISHKSQPNAKQNIPAFPQRQQLLQQQQQQQLEKSDEDLIILYVSGGVLPSTHTEMKSFRELVTGRGIKLYEKFNIDKEGKENDDETSDGSDSQSSGDDDEDNQDDKKLNQKNQITVQNNGSVFPSRFNISCKLPDIRNNFEQINQTLQNLAEIDEEEEDQYSDESEISGFQSTQHKSRLMKHHKDQQLIYWPTNQLPQEKFMVYYLKYHNVNILINAHRDNRIPKQVKEQMKLKEKERDQLEQQQQQQQKEAENKKSPETQSNNTRPNSPTQQITSNTVVQANPQQTTNIAELTKQLKATQAMYECRYTWIIKTFYFLDEISEENDTSLLTKQIKNINDASFKTPLSTKSSQIQFQQSPSQPQIPYNSYPSLQRRVPVMRQVDIAVPPMQSALLDVLEKTKSLITTISTLANQGNIVVSFAADSLVGESTAEMIDWIKGRLKEKQSENQLGKMNNTENQKIVVGKNDLQQQLQQQQQKSPSNLSVQNYKQNEGKKEWLSEQERRQIIELRRKTKESERMNKERKERGESYDRRDSLEGGSNTGSTQSILSSSSNSSSQSQNQQPNQQILRSKTTQFMPTYVQNPPFPSRPPPGSIEPAVSGGIKNYIDCFFNKDYIQELIEEFLEKEKMRELKQQQKLQQLNQTQNFTSQLDQNTLIVSGASPIMQLGALLRAMQAQIDVLWEGMRVHKHVALGPQKDLNKMMIPVLGELQRLIDDHSDLASYI
ncbi:MAG: hypothetical protein EZS28_012953 [Streblomastix strix]|uniref:Uncharacterized protein n=1 Tax=Streblomastix strix TaxID=222440 RepID=A0A5J4W9H6_9EUKA|nr:MAG: hypothetical protein EZS28_012953 [Streblomastix strix]